MSTFRAVNTTLTVPESAARAGEETTPTTPRPVKFFAERPEEDARSEEQSAKTPTRDSFGGLAGQRPLPSTPLGQQGQERSDSKLSLREREGTEGSMQSTKSDDSIKDVKMKDDKDGHDASDNESARSDSNRPSKKKKGQRFFCTDFPPCQLSFTRSEHLARHIRKHTGERPFQCHCSRRFSRLDNLRQHAQTVHVNEDIPVDSLAATGTRYQRQMLRTDRVRPQANRSRASTFSSQPTPHSRGHSRNLSSSSINSISTSSSFGGDELRRGPTPLASDNARSRLSLETYHAAVTSSPSGVPSQYTVGGHSPTGYSTPTSATFSVGTNSPRFPSGLQSPASSHARTLAWASKTPNRRLSVPSGNPFQAPQGASVQPASYFSPIPSATAPTFSGNSSQFASPTGSGFSESRRDSIYAAEAEWRRRTWHPTTHTGLGPRPATSGVSAYQNPPEAPRSVFPSQQQPQPQAQPQQQQSSQLRLPGIESFDHAPPEPMLVRRQPSPMELDPPSRPGPTSSPSGLAVSAGVGGSMERAGARESWDMGLNRGIHKLEIANGSSPAEAPPLPWKAATSMPSNADIVPRSEPMTGHPEGLNDQSMSGRKNKRHAWYNGPLQLGQQGQQQLAPNALNQRTSPEDSSSSDGVPTPSTSSVGDYHPTIVNSGNGLLEVHVTSYAPAEDPKNAGPHQQQPQHVDYRSSASYSLPSLTSHAPSHPTLHSAFGTYKPHANPTHVSPQAGPGHDLRRLEALVAVATREEEVGGVRP